MLQAISLPAADRSSVPHLDQYFGLWAMHEQSLVSHWLLASKLNISLHLQSEQAQAARAAGSDTKLATKDNIAVIGLAGSLMKHQSSYGDSTSTVLARRKLKAAASNPDIAGILLVIDSPGGTVAGTQALADEVTAAGKIKPVWAYCDDLCASAAYWVASQAHQVFADRTSIVGSIGTFAVIQDLSAKAAMEGVKVHVVKAGAFKGSGAPGTEITAELLAEFKDRVDSLNEHFIQGVATGRKLTLDEARILADGRVYVGIAAKSRRLIDGVQSLDQTFSQFVSHVSRRPRQMEASTTLEQNTLATAGNVAPAAAPPLATAAAAPLKPAAASVAELQAACPGASSDFILAQLSGGATVASAQTAFIAEQNKRLEATNKQLADATAAAAAKPAEAHRGPGVRPLPPAQNLGGSAAEVDGDPVAAWEQAVSEEMTRSRCTKAQATQRVATREPKLRESYVAAFNARTPEQRRAS